MLLLAGVLVAAYYFSQQPPVPAGIALEAPNGRLSCELASTPTERAAGLSNRTSLCPACCMLFSFESSGRHGFWMKDMRFPIDIVFLDGDGRVVDAWENAQPCTPQACPVRYPAADARYVVEVNAGAAGRFGMVSGGLVALPQ